MLHDGRQAVVVDPGDSVPVRQTLAALNLNLVGILVTHHHQDHVGGLAGLHEVLQGKVWGPSGERIPGPYEAVSDGQTIHIADWKFQVMRVPGHTAGHVAYLMPRTDEAGVLFCGDTLFSGGCGRLFEGTPEQMLDSLHRLAILPADTQVCCAHEYTAANMRFAQTVEPLNARAAEYAKWCDEQRRAGLPTLPSSIGLETQINPFLRCTVPDVVRCAQDHVGLAGDKGFDGELAVFTILRKWKNEFRS